MTRLEMVTALSGFIRDINVTGPDGNIVAGVLVDGLLGNIVAGVLVGQKISAAIKIQALFRSYSVRRPAKVMVRLRSKYEGAGKGGFIPEP
eukprot:COSAG06_NODE_2620_length_6567_cov_17.636827_4_plen_91_part_00